MYYKKHTPKLRGLKQLPFCVISHGLGICLCSIMSGASARMTYIVGAGTSGNRLGISLHIPRASPCGLSSIVRLLNGGSGLQEQMAQDPGDGSHQYLETWKLQSHSDLRGGDEDPAS